MNPAYHSGNQPVRVTQEQFLQWQQMGQQAHPQRQNQQAQPHPSANVGNHQYPVYYPPNMLPGVPPTQPGSHPLGNRPNQAQQQPQYLQGFQVQFSNPHYQKPRPQSQIQPPQPSTDAPPSYDEVMSSGPSPMYVQPSYYQPPNQPTYMHFQNAQVPAQGQQAPNAVNLPSVPHNMNPIASRPSRPSSQVYEKPSGQPQGYESNAIPIQASQEHKKPHRPTFPDYSLPPVPTSKHQLAVSPPKDFRRQEAMVKLPDSPVPKIYDSNGNPVVFFHIPQKTKEEKPKLVRPSGLVETIRKIPPELQTDIHLFQMENYAKEFFSKQRRGIFRRAVKVESLLEWGKELHGCLLNTLHEKYEKQALEIFRLIQTYMGDRPMPKKGSVNIAQEISSSGVATPELRDEITCQLIKQVTLNPSIPSTIKGWELIAIVIESFPVTKNLEPYVRSYLHESAMHVDTSRVSVYAAYCLRRYDARWKQNTVVRIPTKEEIKKIQSDPFSGAMFGGSLQEILTQQKEQYPNVHIPRVMAVICDCILESGGETAEGIFRISANIDKVYETKVLLEKGASSLEKSSNPHIPACLLKTWLYELKEPIIPAEHYDLFIRNDGKLQELTKAVYNIIPDVNRNTLLYLIRFLRIIGKPENQVYTLMNLHNMALIFSPNVFRCPIEDPMTQLQNTKIETSVLELLLKELRLPDSIPGVYGVRGSA